MRTSKILVVDDDPGVLRLLEHVLIRESYEVLTASNGIEGLRTAEKASPDLVVLDVMLPGLDGFEVCSRLRSGAMTAQIPVLMLSAKGQAIDRDTGLRVGANEYLLKPVDRTELLDTVERLLVATDPTVERLATVIGFIGAKGGVGTSTVAASVSAAMAYKEQSPILVDLCPSLGVSTVLMGLKPGKSIGDLFRGEADPPTRDELEAALLHHSHGVRVLATEQLTGGYSVTMLAGMEGLWQELAPLADHLLLDMPATPSEIVAFALSKCDLVSIVAGADTESIARVNLTAASLSRLGVDAARLGAIFVDRIGAGFSAEIPGLKFVGDIPVMGVVPYDADECADAEERGVPVVLSAPLSPVALALNRLTQSLLALDPPTPPGGVANDNG